MLKKALAALIIGTPNILFAECPDNLLGRWELAQFKMTESDNWEEFTGPYWEYRNNGQVQVMMGQEHAYSCQDNLITIDTPIKTRFEIMSMSSRSMEVKVNDGDDGFFVIEKE